MNEHIFTTIQNQKTYKEVVERIVEAVKAGNLKPGDRLPTEVKLANIMGVSRSSIREALSALKVTGLINSRSGYGNYVCDVPTTNGGNTVAQLLQLVEKENPLDIIEARECVEPKTARFAAERANQEDLARMEEIANKMNALIRDDKTFLDLDIEFHTAVALAAHSDTLIGIVKYLIGKMKEESWQTFKERNLFLPGRRNETLKEHMAVLKALKEKEPFIAQKAMLKHLQNIKAAMISRGF